MKVGVEIKKPMTMMEIQTVDDLIKALEPMRGDGLVRSSFGVELVTDSISANGRTTGHREVTITLAGPPHSLVLRKGDGE